MSSASPTLFQRLLRRSDPRQGLSPLYRAIVAEGRQPHWYVKGQVPDSIDGRFDMIVAILALVLTRLDALEATQESVWLTELFVDDMDGQLRQEGIGDVVVGKHVGRMMSALGGRIAAYRAVADNGPALREAIARNLYRGTPPADTAIDHAESALRAVWARLEVADRPALLRGDFA
ncbi:MAG: ubiquinol-cytochrome C chaperone family protein [Sphingobium sp.]